MTKLLIHGVPVVLADGVDPAKGRELASRQIKARYARPMAVWPGKISSEPQVGFIRTDKEASLTKDAAFVQVPLADCMGKLYPIKGLSPKNVTDRETEMARKLWEGQINVDIDDDGELSLDF